MSPKERNLLLLRILSMQADFDTGLLALMIQKSDQDLWVSRQLFPLEMKAGRAVELESTPINALVEKGVIERAEDGVFILVEPVIRLLSEQSRVATNTTTTGRSSKKASTTVFVFQASPVHGQVLAFVPQIGARVRNGIVSQIAMLDFETAQLIVHEVGARIMNGSIKGDAVTYARGIVAKAMRGQFVPAAGLALADELDAQLVDDVATERKELLRVVK